MEQQTPRTNKEMITDIIASVHPEADLADEEVLFGIIYDDYEKYAELIASREEDIEKAREEGERDAREKDKGECREAGGDGVPALGGITLSDPRSANTIFDLAALA